MLSAVVVGVSGEPGKGFYGLAEQLGKKIPDDLQGRRQFWEEEKQAVYDTWKVELRDL